MRVLAEKKTMVSGLRVLISYEVAFKRSLRCLRRRLLDVLWCTPASPPPRRLVIILNATPYHRGTTCLSCGRAANPLTFLLTWL
jgi:hypothetical protein